MNRFIGGLACASLLVALGPACAEDVTGPGTAAKISPAQLQQWLADLDSDSFETREAAAEKLSEAGPAAVDVLARGVVSDSAETAWRSGASLERIAMTSDEKTLGRITSILDNLSVKGKPGLKTMAAEMHLRQKSFRHDRAVASLKQNGAIFSGDGMELGGGAVFMGGPVIMADPFGGPVPVMEAMDVIEVEAVPEPVLKDGIFGLIGRIFGGGAAPPVEIAPPADIAPPVGIDESRIDPPGKPDETVPENRPAGEETPSLEDKPAVEAEPAPDLKPAAEEKPAEIEAGEPAQVLEEFKELSKPAAEPVAEDAQALEPPPAIVEDIAVAAPLGVDFGFIGMIDEGAVQTTAALMLGKQWRGGDDGLKVLKDVPEIWSIAVQGAKITDASLSYMAELPNLNALMIRDTNVTREGLRKLRGQKPNLQIQARGEAMMGVNADVGTSPLVLTSIFRDSGAAEAGLREGDVISKVDETPIKDFPDLTISIYGRKAGEKVKVEYERGGEKKTAVVVLKKRPDGQ